MEGDIKTQKDWKLASSTFLELLAKVILVITPLAYLAGYYFLQGYLNAYGIPDSLIEMNADEVLIHAFLAFIFAVVPFFEWFNGFFTVIGFFILLLVGWLILFGVCFYFVHQKSLNNRKKTQVVQKVLYLYFTNSRTYKESVGECFCICY